LCPVKRSRRRRDLFGEDALKLKHGKLAIGLSGDGANVEVSER
jgi:hypothetical protein